MTVKKYKSSFIISICWWSVKLFLGVVMLIHCNYLGKAMGFTSIISNLYRTLICQNKQIVMDLHIHVTITQYDSLDMFEELDVPKSTGPDGISSRIFKETVNAICSSSTDKSFSYHYPLACFQLDRKGTYLTNSYTKWKRYKYVYISRFSCVNKILERIILNCL